MKSTRLAAVPAVLLLCLTALTACGGSSSEDDAPSDSSSSSARPGAPSMDSSQLEAIQQCLDAAGIDTQMPTDMPSDMPTDMPTDMPSEMPSGMDGGGLADPEVADALEACGIDLPAAPGGAG